MNIRKVFLVLLLLGFSTLPACSGEKEYAALEAEFGVPFELHIGQVGQISTAGLTIEFMAVTSDSRCPEEVECAEAGRVSVLINMSDENGAIGDYTLTLDHQQENAITTTPGDYTVELIEVSPYPVTTKLIPMDEYLATFLVSRN